MCRGYKDLVASGGLSDWIIIFMNRISETMNLMYVSIIENARFPTAVGDLVNTLLSFSQASQLWDLEADLASSGLR